MTADDVTVTDAMRRCVQGRAVARRWRVLMATIIVAVALLTVGALDQRSATAQDDARRESADSHVPVPLVAASSDTHAWWVAPAIGTAGELRLYLHTTEMAANHHRPLMPLSTAPHAMTAWGERIWLVYTTTTGDGVRREVFSLDAVRIPIQGIYVPDPPDRLRVRPPLPGRGVLAGFVATDNGPVALLTPDAASRRAPDVPDAPDADAASDAADSEVADPGHDEPRHDDPTLPALLHMTATGWRSIDLPEAFDSQRDWRVLATGPGNRTVWLLTTHPNRRDHTLVFRRTLDTDMTGGRWETQTHDLPMSRVITLVDAGAPGLMPAAVLRDRSDDTMRLVYIRPDRALPLATLEGVTMRWAVMALRDGFRLIEQSTQSGLRIRTIGLVDGRVSAPMPMEQQPLGTSRVMHIPLILTLAVTAMILWMLMRAGKQPEHAPPGRWKPLPIVPRLVALMIDLAPAGVLAVLALDRSPGELLLLPAWTADMEQATPAIVMVALAVAHATVSEMIWGVSLGKVLVGARVIRLDGSEVGDRPRMHQTLVRNAFKALTLLAPPLAIFALLSPLLQGLGDQFTTTLVAYQAPTEEEAQRHADAARRPDRDS